VGVGQVAEKYDQGDSGYQEGDVDEIFDCLAHVLGELLA